MTITPRKIYQNRLSSGELRPDPIQEYAIDELQNLFDEIMEDESAPKQNFFLRMAGIGAEKGMTPKGLYLHGGVGRGKSMLMDLFYDTLPEGVNKRRVHFHEFMIEVHDYINKRACDGSKTGAVDQALPSLAESIAVESRILCFDEFYVVDITDAMILGRLFKILFENDVIVVATSNWAPDDLYKDGLQRDRFLPFIELLKSKVTALFLDSPHDYRAQKIQIEGTYFNPLGWATRKKLDGIFKDLIGDETPEEGLLSVKGRDIKITQAAGGVARFTFAQLCERPHGVEDYLEIAHNYHTVFLEGVPKLSYDRRNEAKRLINLIDALYEARVRVIISAAAEADKLYMVGDHAYEFERTVSRLLEMQSDAYP